MMDMKKKKAIRPKPVSPKACYKKTRYDKGGNIKQKKS